MTLIRAARDADLLRIVAILNDAITHTTAIWSLRPATLEARAAWLAERTGRGFPVLVAERAGQVLGFASFGNFRPFDGYLHTVEHSLYVDAACRRQGVGKAMLDALIGRARDLGMHAMIGGIEAGNLGSLDLHRQAGFIEAGRLPEVGRKFDRWLDLVFMQKMLND